MTQTQGAFDRRKQLDFIVDESTINSDLKLVPRMVMNAGYWAHPRVHSLEQELMGWRKLLLCRKAEPEEIQSGRCCASTKDAGRPDRAKFLRNPDGQVRRVEESVKEGTKGGYAVLQGGRYLAVVVDGRMKTYGCRHTATTVLTKL